MCFHPKGEQEVGTSNILIQEEPLKPEPPLRAREPNRGVILSSLLQEEPPNVPTNIRLQRYRGKVLDSQRRMKANLLSLGADCIVSRTKPFQEGEYDEDIKSSSAEEQGIMRHGVESMKLGRAKETSSDIGSFKEGYLCNHEEFKRETTCYEFSTQQEHAANWFHSKRINGLGDIPFPRQRWPDLPYLEDQGHMLCQTHYWRPGDFGLLLEALHNPLTCTSTHWMRRIQEKYHQTKLELFMEDWAITWFTQYQTKIWQPGDIFHKPEKPEEIVISFKTQRIKRRRIWNKLPYLEEPNTYSVINLQQLFCLFFGVMKTYWTNLETPKLHHYMPKLSRLKQSPASSHIPLNTPNG